MDIRVFRGLSNVTDPLRAGAEWLSVADNVNVSDSGGLSSRSGYSRVSTGNYTAAYATKNFLRMYVVVDGILKTAEGVTLKTGMAEGEMVWAEVNDQVFFTNGTDSGVLMPDNTLLPWAWPVPSAPSVAAVTGTLPPGAYIIRCSTVLPDGRETGTGDAAEIVLGEGQALQISGIPQTLGGRTNVYIAPANSTVFQLAASVTGTSMVFGSSPDTLGRELLNIFLDPLPNGVSAVQEWKGRMYAAQYMPENDQTVIWFSEALGYHLFNLNSNYFLVPGQVTMLAPHDAALIVGTESRIYAYDTKTLSQLAEYGTVPGQHWAADGDERILFWTTRGVCSALPFKNLTERQVSVAPGTKAGGTIVRDGGQKRYVVTLQQGGSAFNSYP